MTDGQAKSCPKCGVPLVVPNPAVCRACGESLVAGPRSRPVEPQGDRLRKLSAELSGARERIYVLRLARAAPDSDGFVLRPGSLTVSRGRAPFVALHPKHESGEPMQHLFTLDLDDVPELRSQFPGARAVCLFCPMDGEAELLSEVRIVAPTLDHEVALDSESQRLALLPLDVPAVTFSDDAPRAVSDLRRELFNADAYVLGAPIWYQGRERLPGKWLLQINRLFDDELLYVASEGVVHQR